MPTIKKVVLRTWFLALVAIVQAAIGCHALVCRVSASEDVPATSPWKFGILADTQWSGKDDGRSPNGIPAGIIKQIDKEFIRHGVRFVVAVGDTVDKGTPENIRVRALYVQDLYNANVGYYPLRGNHEASCGGLDGSGPEFQRAFPQTQNGINNATPAYPAGLGVDTHLAPDPKTDPKAFLVGCNFSSPDLAYHGVSKAGLSYSFDVDNVRCILLDQWDDSGDTKASTISEQQKWIDTRLADPKRPQHAFVFAHKCLLGPKNKDNLFGKAVTADDPGDGSGVDVSTLSAAQQATLAAKQAAENWFIGSLVAHRVPFFICGHDHLHDRSIVTSPDGKARVQQIVGQSASNKFNLPQPPRSANMVTLVQDLNKIGFYICTIDGPRANIDYFGATVDAEARSPSETPKTPDASNVAGPTRPKPKKFVIAKTPDLSGKWEKLDTFGYNLDDPASLVPQEKPSAEAKRVPTEPIQNAAGDSAAIGDAAKRLLEQSDYHISQTNGDREPASLAAEIQWISKTWDCSASRMPYLVYMPEKDRLLMLVTCHKASATIHSDDHGRTWSDRRWLCLDENGQPKTRANALTYLGQGKLLATDDHALWGSSDFGQTWAMCQRMPEAKPLSWWDPVLVVKDSAGGVERLVWASSKSEGPPWGTEEKPYSQGFLQSSTDEGRSWSDPGKVPQWRGTDEIAMTIAKNGDWIAACRTDCPFRLAHLAIGRRHPGKESFDHNDPTYAAAHLATFGRQAGAAHWDHYFGLGVSISKDQGKTWSDLKPLYEWGRHHPSMVVFPDGRIVMTYVVRIGYPDTADGFPQYGVEAVVSSDNGQTWDMEHRYVLAQWAGTLKGEHAYYCAVQSSSTVLLPDGTLLTVFGTGVNSLDTANKKDIAMVRWRLAPAT